MRDFETGLTLERLKERLHYDPDTGLFTRKQSVGASKAGSVVTYTFPGCGYIGIRIDGFLYYGHRLAWFYMTGRWPEGEIDHKDRVRPNNAFSNLREATPQQNRQNHGLQRNNTSGVSGVTWCKRTKKWQASIVLKRKPIFLGRHPYLSDAVAARRAAEHQYFGEYRPC